MAQIEPAWIAIFLTMIGMIIGGLWKLSDQRQKFFSQISEEEKKRLLLELEIAKSYINRPSFDEAMGRFTEEVRHLRQFFEARFDKVDARFEKTEAKVERLITAGNTNIRTL